MSVKVMSWVWEHSPARGSELLLLLALADFADDHGMNAYPSIDRLARKCRVGRTTVKRLLHKLVESGQLTVDRGHGRGHTNRYRLLQEKGLDRAVSESENGPDRASLLQERGPDRTVLLREKGPSEPVKGSAAAAPDPSGTVINGGGYVTRARAREAVVEDPTPPINSIDDELGPPRRCAAHADIGDPPPCGACKEARARRSRWDHDQEMQRRAAAGRARREAARERNRAIHACTLCDQNGYLPAGAVCNHDPAQLERNSAGVAAARAALADRKSSEEG